MEGHAWLGRAHDFGGEGPNRGLEPSSFMKEIVGTAVGYVALLVVVALLVIPAMTMDVLVNWRTARSAARTVAA